MAQLINKIGQKYGSLRVLNRGPTKKKHTSWICQCDCGNICVVDSGNLSTGHTKSCGHCEKYEMIDEKTMRCLLPSGKSFIFDVEDYPLVSQHKWSVEDSGYVSTTYNNQHIRLHKILLPSKELFCDHINGIRSDNRRCNLRLATNQQNVCNKGLQKNNSSGYKGVSFDKRRGKYYSSIMVNGRHHFLGYTSSLIEAAEAYDKAAVFYFGEYAGLNFRKEESKNGS